MKLLIFIVFVVAFVIFKVLRGASAGVRAAHHEVFGKDLNHTAAPSETEKFDTPSSTAMRLQRAAATLGAASPKKGDVNGTDMAVAHLAAAIAKDAAELVGKRLEQLTVKEASCLNVVTIVAVDALSQRTRTDLELGGLLATSALWLGQFEGEATAAILDNSTRGFNDIGRDPKWSPMLKLMGNVVLSFFDSGNRDHLSGLLIPTQALLSLPNEQTT